MARPVSYFTALSQHMLNLGEEREALLEASYAEHAQTLTVFKDVVDGVLPRERVTVTVDGWSVSPEEPADEDTDEQKPAPIRSRARTRRAAK